MNPTVNFNRTYNYPAGPVAADGTGLGGRQHALGLSAGDVDAGHGDGCDRDDARLPGTAHGPILLPLTTGLVSLDGGLLHQLCLVLLFYIIYNL